MTPERYIVGPDGVPYGPFAPAHESPAAVHDHIAADNLREHAARLTAQFEVANRALGDPERKPMLDWVAWEGQAYSILKELTRG